MTDTLHYIPFEGDVEEAVEHRFLHSMFHKQDVLGSFPLGYPLSAIYAPAAFRLQTLAVVITQDRQSIRRHLEFLRKKGLSSPAVSVLDGFQVPHEERDVLDAVHQRKVRILFTTPEKFSSAAFLQIFTHVTVGFLVIEHGQFCLEGYSGSFRYYKICKSLEAIRRRPPMAIFTPPLSEETRERLTQKLKLDSFQFLEKEPVFEKSRIRVKRFLTGHQKFSFLFRYLGGGRPENSEKPRPAVSNVILTMDSTSCEALKNQLIAHGMKDVYAYHQGISWGEFKTLERIFAHVPGATIITSGYSNYSFTVPRTQAMRLIFWQPAMGLEELVWNCFRQTEEDAHRFSAIVLYTREDYMKALKKISAESAIGHGEWYSDVLGIEALLKHQTKKLKEFRKWVLSSGCRFQTLAEQAKSLHSREIHTSHFHPCGSCDQCRSHPFKGVLGVFLQYWLY